MVSVSLPITSQHLMEILKCYIELVLYLIQRSLDKPNSLRDVATCLGNSVRFEVPGLGLYRVPVPRRSTVSSRCDLPSL
jgi:hypothetical protein